MPAGPPGAIAIVQRGARTQLYSAGVANVQTGAAVRTSDHMRLASVAKPTITQVEGFATGAGCGIVATCDLSVATADSQIGIPIDIRGNFSGSFFDLLNPYAIVAGLVTAALFAMHGSIYLFLKLPQGEARD